MSSRNRDRVYTCEKHFASDDIEICKYNSTTVVFVAVFSHWKRHCNLKFLFFLLMKSLVTMVHQRNTFFNNYELVRTSYSFSSFPGNSIFILFCLFLGLFLRFHARVKNACLNARVKTLALRDIKTLALRDIKRP